MMTPLLILFILSTPMLVAWIYSRLRQQTVELQPYAFWGLGAAFLFFALGHFVQAGSMVAMLPPWLPLRELAVYLSGMLEIMIGVALFLPRYQVIAAQLAIMVLISFFPVNVYAAWNYVPMGGHQWGPVYLWIRAPLQIILIAWAYFLCIKTPATLKATNA
jgi:uncharacterized membrane protein